MRNKLSKNGILCENMANYFKNSLDKINEEIVDISENSRLSKKVKKKLEELAALSSKTKKNIEKVFMYDNVTEIPSIIDSSFFETEFKNEILNLVPPDIKFNLHIADNSPCIYVAKNLLKDAILNLIQNSIDSLSVSKGDEISLIVKEQEKNSNIKKKYLTISIIDNGSGLSDDDFPKIFLPFTSMKENHSGIGLYNTLNIIKYFRGWIDAESIPDKKTSFIIYLPIYETKDSSPKIVPFMEKEVKLLLIEDEVELITFISRSLFRYGYKITMAKSAKEARKIIDENNGNFDIIFADIMLQDGNGLELSKEIFKKYQNIKFVINSGFIDLGEIEEELNKYGFHFIEKPYKINQLTQKISDVLKS